MNILTQLADNEALMEAVKQAILKRFEIPYAESASDELLGQVTRARLVGRAAVESAFSEIASYKSKPKAEEKVNRAR